MEGLIPSETQNYELNAASIIKKKVSLKFDSIKKEKRGVFIIDISGNGILSRAVIKKGALTVVEEYTIVGH